MPFAQHETRWQGGNLRLTFDAIHRDHGVACLAIRHPSMLTAETMLRRVSRAQGWEIQNPPRRAPQTPGLRNAQIRYSLPDRSLRMQTWMRSSGDFLQPG